MDAKRPKSDDRITDLTRRLEDVERMQAQLLAGLGEIAAVISRLTPTPGRPDHETAPDIPAAAPSGVAVPKSGARPEPDLVDLVWDAFEFNADAYAFWHNPHPALGGKAPKQAAAEPGADRIIRRLIAEIRSGS